MADSPFSSVQPSVLRDQVCSAIRSAIVSGSLRPGTRLVENEFAVRMGVSKAPVREALRLLEAEGIVTTIPHRGTFVTRLTVADIKEVHALRGAIERLAVGLFMDHPNPTILNELRATVETMRCAESKGDLSGLTEADFRFHELIVFGCASQRTARLWSDMQGLIMMLATEIDFTVNLTEGTTDRHLPILMAIEAGDRNNAQTLLEEHILNSARHLETALKARDDKKSAKPES